MFRFSHVVICLCLGVGCASDSDIGTVPFELSDPNADVTITVDGKQIQVTSLRQPFDFSVGDHVLRVEGDRYLTIERTWQVMSGVNPVFRIDLQREDKMTDVARLNVPDTDTDTARDAADSAESDQPQVAVTESEEPKYEPDAKLRSHTETPDSEAEDDSFRTPREQELAEWVKSVKGYTYDDDRDFTIHFRSYSSITREDFRRFNDLPHLQRLVLANPKMGGGSSALEIGDREILQLRELPKLSDIGFIGKSITDRSMEHLAQFPIKHLSIGDSNITDEGLAHLARHKLVTLGLTRNPGISDVGILSLDLSIASRIDLVEIPVTDRAMAAITSSPVLEHLGISSTSMTGQGFAAIPNSNRIRFLHLNQISVHDQHLESLTNLRELESLTIINGALSVRGLQYILDHFPALTSLNIAKATQTQIGEDEILNWTRMKNLTYLAFKGVTLSDRHLKSLTVLKNLESLGVITTGNEFNVSRQGLLAFKAALPACTINDKSVDELIRELSQ